MSPRRLAALLLLLIILLIVGALLFLNSRPTMTQPITPTNGPISGSNPHTETRQMMFMSNRDGDWDIYVMSLGDRSVTNLTNNDSDDGFASYSTDGKAIFFLSNRGGKLDPYMMDADGSNPKAVTNDLPTILSVVTSGRLNWDTAYVVQALHDETALVSLRDLNLEIYLHNANSETNLTKNGANDWLPTWSPDGTKLAFDSDRDGNQEIYVMDADGSNQHRLTNAPGDDLYPMWGYPTLYFMSDRDIPFAKGQIGLYALNLDDPAAQPQRVTKDTVVNLLDEQIWYPDRSRIFVMNGAGNWDIYYADSVGRNQINLTDNSADDLFPVWRPQPG